MKLFETTVVRKLIEYTWPAVLKYTVIMLFIPYLTFLILYLIYIHATFGDASE